VARGGGVQRHLGAGGHHLAGRLRGHRRREVHRQRDHVAGGAAGGGGEDRLALPAVVRRRRRGGPGGPVGPRGPPGGGGAVSAHLPLHRRRRVAAGRGAERHLVAGVDGLVGRLGGHRRQHVGRHGDRVGGRRAQGVGEHGPVFGLAGLVGGGERQGVVGG